MSRPCTKEAKALLAQAVGLHQASRLAEAVETYHRALAADPDCFEACYNLGVALFQQDQIVLAQRAFARAVELQPRDAEALNNLAKCHKELGRLDEAGALYRRALELAPRPEIHSNLLVCLSYLPGLDPARLLAEHRAWARRFETPQAADPPHHPNPPDPERPLQVGLVSPDLRRHPVAFFLLPVLEALDQEHYSITCYANSPVEDEVTARLQALARRWRRTASLDDAHLAARIRADGIDLLIDLAGHTAGNRLTVFARRPAPVQATWLGYELTTGLEAMDYLISDPHTLPPGHETLFTEEVVRLPGGHLCFRPPEYAPAVTPPPCLTRGGLTLGCFNNPAKINPEVARLWARLLAAVPQARLVVGYKTLRHRREQEVMRRRLAGAGMDPRRLEVVGWEDHARALAAYHAVDLALDPFPHGGTTTTFEALWMGVPVLTLPGASPVSRLSVAPLRELGLGELVTTSPDQFVATAVALARAPQRLAAWRAELRRRMAASSLCRGQPLARRLEEAWREMWRRWCAGQRR